MKRPAWLCASLLVLVGGCPLQPAQDSSSAVTATIAISSTQGPPPLWVTVSAADSSSLNGGTLQYLWDFAGQALADTETANHTFTSPGLYTIALRVSDQNSEEDVTSVDVRVQGSSPVAVIQADNNAGTAPLLVSFDGTGSYADDDVIRDYYWVFGDGSGVNRQPTCTHVFDQVGEFTVTLTVATAGGVENSTTTTIATDASRGSLQFDGNQFATLPIAASEQTLAACTFETWFKAGTAGGSLVSVGNGALLVEIRPNDDAIRFQFGGAPQEVSASNLSGLWRHVALAYDAAGDATLYLDGVALTSVSSGQAIVATQLTVGMGFTGKVAEVRFWSEARTAAQIAGDYDRRLSTAPAGLLGYWRLDEGSGQSLTNRAGSSLPGWLGSSTAADVADPGWSTDGPNLD